MIKLLCIDPSVQSLGWSLSNLYEDHGVLIDVGEIKNTKGTWINRLDIFIDTLHDLFVDSLDVQRSLTYHDTPSPLVLIEQPCVYHTGRGAVASNAESIMKLSSFVFALRQMFLDYTEVEVKLITPRIWKGQIKKPITWKRNLKYWAFKSDNHDIQDAVGLADFWIRKHLKIKDLRNEII